MSHDITKCTVRATFRPTDTKQDLHASNVDALLCWAMMRECGWGVMLGCNAMPACGMPC